MVNYCMQQYSRKRRGAMSLRFVSICLLFLVGFRLEAASITQLTDERVTVNWSAQKLRFYGESKIKPGAENGYKKAEKRAWQDGINYINQIVMDMFITSNEGLVEDMNLLERAAKAAANRVSTSTYSYNTAYYEDGTVRVFLENSLPKAIATDLVRFHQKKSIDDTVVYYSGVLIEVEGANGLNPASRYTIQSSEGKILFDIKDMAEDAYNARLMARWFRSASQNEVKQAVGSNPLTVAAKSDGRNIIIDQQVWNKEVAGHVSLLRKAKVAISLLKNDLM